MLFLGNGELQFRLPDSGTELEDAIDLIEDDEVLGF